MFENGRKTRVNHINGYLLDAPDVFIQSRGACPSGMPQMIQGNKPWDGGFLVLTSEEAEALVQAYPKLSSVVRLYVGSYELINGKKRYCLWLKGVSPALYRGVNEISRRLEVAETRRSTKTVAVQAQAQTPMLFSQIRQPETDYLAIPEVSSQNRRYIPICFMNPDVIASNKLFLVPDATKYMFGVMTSNVHMAWMRTVCGRLKSDYSYSPSIYNNFPWPIPTDFSGRR